MRNWTLSILAAITFVLATPVKNAAAMPVATADQLGRAASSPRSAEKTVLLCDAWTCYWRPGNWSPPSPYSSWRRHYWWGWRPPAWGWRRW